MFAVRKMCFSYKYYNTPPFDISKPNKKKGLMTFGPSRISVQIICFDGGFCNWRRSKKKSFRHRFFVVV